MGRVPCCDKTRVRRGPWSPEEDALLKNFFIKFGNDGSWISLPKKVGLNRCGKSCRLRWLNYLRPNIKHGSFTKEEDHIIYDLYNIIGSRWSIIASCLRGRTDNDVKNYWHTNLKKKILEGKVNNNVTSTKITSYYENISSNVSITKSCMNSTIPNVNLWQNEDEVPQYYTGMNTSNTFTIEESSSPTTTTTAAAASSSSTTTTTGSSEISRVSSSVSSNQNSHALITSYGREEDEFWIDLLSKSFDDDIGVESFQLDDKISEIATLLDFDR